jgi:dolichyl-phosphate-mannose-protein mannosyltransferase
MEFLLPLIVCLSIGAALTYGLTARMAPGERAWVRRVVILALILRLAMATLFALVPETRIFHEDAEGYEAVGMHIADGWAGRGPPYPFVTGLPNRGFFYISAAIYYVMLGVRPAVSYVDAIFGSLTVLFVYRLSRRFFHPIVARLAANLTAFTPSMVLWSSVALKDPLMALLVLLTLDASVELKRRFSVRALLGVVLPIIAMQPIRFYMIYFLFFAVAGSLMIERGGKLLTGLPKQLLFGAAVVGLLALVGLSGAAQQNTELMTLQSLSTFRYGMATTANSGFDANVDVSTPARALTYLPVGIASLLLAPFPWQFGSMRAAFAAPEMIVWWSLFPSLISGIIFAVRRQFSRVAPLIIFAMTMTAAYGLMQGNVGSGFRQRAQIFVVLFIFTSLGWYRRKCRRAGIDPNLLVVED